MTDNEIIKALEHCVKTKFISDCAKCEMFAFDCKDILIENALDLINRQKAEIERLDQESDILEEELENRNKDIYDLISKERSNAILEFVEALKQETDDDFVFIDIIDSLAKVMTEVEE